MSPAQNSLMDDFELLYSEPMAHGVKNHRYDVPVRTDWIQMKIGIATETMSFIMSRLYSRTILDSSIQQRQWNKK